MTYSGFLVNIFVFGLDKTSLFSNAPFWHHKELGNFLWISGHLSGCQHEKRRWLGENFGGGFVMGTWISLC
jgi:hypothetical protein